MALSLSPAGRRGVLLAAWLCLVSACTMQQRPILSAQDETDIARAQTYLNSLHAFEARFTQSGALGPGAGLVFLRRPGELRIDYQGPSARLMVIAQGHVAVLDRRTGALTTMALSRTPLGLLLAPQIDLTGAVRVLSATHAQGGLQLTLQKSDAPAQGTLRLDLAEAPLRLQAVTVTDAYQRSSTLVLSDMVLDPVLTPDLFVLPSGA